MDQRKIMIILLGSLFLIFLLIHGLKSINQNIQNNSNLPDRNITCEGVIPEEVIFLDAGVGKPFVCDLTKAADGEKLYEEAISPCMHSAQPGQDVNQFRCGLDYFVKGKVSEGGIILQDYRVNMKLLFDDRECFLVEGLSCSSRLAAGYTSGDGSGLAIRCKVIQSSCSWNYVH